MTDVRRERGRGVETATGAVPVVSTVAIFDLAVGEPAWPGPDEGRAACLAAVSPSAVDSGRVGVGTGATTNKLAEIPILGGFGGASQQVDDVMVSALVIINAAGAIDGTEPPESLIGVTPTLEERTSTTIVAVVIDGPAEDQTCGQYAVTAVDTMARKIGPCQII